MLPPLYARRRQLRRDAFMRAWPALRWLPFVLGALLSIAISFAAPDGRKPFHIDWDFSAAALHYSIVKGPHIGASALVALLAVVATGRQRLGLALLLTIAVGWGWELGQTTVIGHQARLSDLAPDAFGAALGYAWGACVMWLGEALLGPPAAVRQTDGGSVAASSISVCGMPSSRYGSPSATKPASA